MSKFRPGDVVIYSDEAVAIVDDRDIDPDDVPFAVWRGSFHPDDRWYGFNETGQMPAALCKPHPDPDRILAEYTAWILTHAD